MGATKEGSLRELLEYLMPSLRRTRLAPSWPPDMFALVATALERSGAYFRVVDLVEGARKPMFEPDWSTRASDVARAWRERLERAIENAVADQATAVRAVRAPREIAAWWLEVWTARDVELSQLHEDRHGATCRALIALLAVADEASKGMGIRVDERVLSFANGYVLPRSRSGSLCLDVHATKARVLPKQHTSQRGITLRSLTHHLALQSAVGVRAEWTTPITLAPETQLDLLNLLLLPWPEVIDRGNFDVARESHGAPETCEPFRFFHWDRPDNPRVFEERFEAAITEAKRHVHRVHGVVFPELALSLAEYKVAERIAVREQLLLIAGISLRAGESLGGEHRGPINVCAVQSAGLSAARGTPELTRQVRAKNHRWCLNESQIVSYGLQSRLPTSKDCWELTTLQRRHITFQTLGTWMTLCVQICEDLARQDEVTNIIRSVGPNLVVALLMDAPQLQNRWPSRYASILADDPGSSVLTLTSLGMTKLSRPRPSERDRRNVIALWRDISNGDREIEIAEGESGCLIHVVCKTEQEFTADGRGDGGVAHFPVLVGSHGIRLPASTPPPERLLSMG